MNILFIAPYIPSRIRVRPFYIIRELSKHHRVSVIALAEGEDATVSSTEELASFAESVEVVSHSRLRGLVQSLASLPTSQPMCCAYCRSPHMSVAVQNAIARQQFDVVHVEHLRAAHFAPLGRDLPVVFDAVDCLTSLFSQMAQCARNPVSKLVMAEEAWKLKRHEPRTMRMFNVCLATSESERAAFLELDQGLDVRVAPNGVDSDYFVPYSTPRAAHRIVFSGKMSYAPNIKAVLWFAREVLPKVRLIHPDAEFLVVGSTPHTDVVCLGDQPGITVTGYVDDIRPHLASASVAVVPMQIAVGIQNKALEAMAMGLPVVATPIALRALGELCPGSISARDVDEMVALVCDLLANPDKAVAIGREGRTEVVTRFSWARCKDVVEDAYEAATAGLSVVT